MMPKKPNSKSHKPDGLAILEQRVAELTEALQRERADATNAARRSQEQLASAREHAKASVVSKFLPVVDSIERALKSVPKELVGSDFVKGVEAIAKQFETAFTSLGVERIKTVGEEFNPELHEAISMEDGEGKKEIVSEELQSGYKLGDQVVRHAMVRVKMQ